MAIEIYDDCFVTIEDQQEAIAEAKSICLSYGGGGAVFDVLAPSVPVTCKILLKTGEIKVFEKYYAVKYDCNTCGSSEMQQELQVYEALCNADCRQNAVKCIHQRFEWSSYFEKTGTVYGENN